METYVIDRITIVDPNDVSVLQARPRKTGENFMRMLGRPQVPIESNVSGSKSTGYKFPPL